MKFSIVVPVYNVEKYIINCLESINEQSYKNFEVIIVNDGSPDNSEKLIKKFIKDKKQFKYYKKENGGLSDARNYGLKYVTGDYIIFVDSDDTINKDLLYELNEQIKKTNDDIIKFNIQLEKENSKKIASKNNFNTTNVDTAIIQILNDEFVEPAVMYCYNYIFWKKYKFQYAKDRYHEDFGLTPLVLMEAKKISSIDYVGYNYNIRANSIMTSQDEEKDLKKFNDCLYYFIENTKKIKNCKNINKETKKLLESYYANGIINKCKILKNGNFKFALKKIKELRIYNYLIDNTLKRKLKKYTFKMFPKIYIKGI